MPESSVNSVKKETKVLCLTIILNEYIFSYHFIFLFIFNYY